jgi:hypothetical protein
MKKNKIEINLDLIENINTRNFIQAEIAHCKKHKVRVELLNAPPELHGVESSGLFSDEPHPCLQVHMDKDINEWLPIFVHETCHKDQYIEKTDIWTAKINEHYDAVEIFDMWIDRCVELKPHQLRPVLQQIVDIELDCERRAVEKIHKNNLDINVEEYIQKANSYVYYYHAAAHTRMWTQRTAPYINPLVWKEMPVDFNNNYATIRNKMLELYLEHCY